LVTTLLVDGSESFNSNNLFAQVSHPFILLATISPFMKTHGDDPLLPTLDKNTLTPDLLRNQTLMA
jgi:hypothetical protein